MAHSSLLSYPTCSVRALTLTDVHDSRITHYDGCQSARSRRRAIIRHAISGKVTILGPKLEVKSLRRQAQLKEDPVRFAFAESSRHAVWKQSFRPDKLIVMSFLCFLLYLGKTTD
jgi:hypothetical protein